MRVSNKSTVVTASLFGPRTHLLRRARSACTYQSRVFLGWIGVVIVMA